MNYSVKKANLKGTHPDSIYPKESLPLWIRVPVPVTEVEMRQIIGMECEHPTYGCATCDAWRMFHRCGKLPVLVERTDLLKLTQGAEVNL